MRNKTVLFLTIVVCEVFNNAMVYGVVESMEPIVVDLPGLTGEYPIFSGRKANFDIGEPIPFEIGAISLTIDGSYESGVALLNGTELRDPFHAGFASEIQTGGPMDVWWNPLPGPWWTNHEIESCEFRIEYRYEQIGNASWDFLADGEAEIPLTFSSTISWGTIILQPPYAELTEATFRIYPVPEPATVFLLGLGAVAVFRRRR